MANLRDQPAWRLYLPSTRQTRMPQVTIRRPFGELDLRDQVRVEPHTVFHYFFFLTGFRGRFFFGLLDASAFRTACETRSKSKRNRVLLNSKA
jgi:hypothetical protein